MAINVKSNVSPLGGRLDPTDPAVWGALDRLTRAQTARTPSELIPDPRSDVRAVIPSPFEPYKDAAPEDKEAMLSRIPAAEDVRRGEIPWLPADMDEVGAIASKEGIPTYMPTAGGVGLMTPEGNAVFDETTGEDVVSPFTIQDYQGQVESEVTNQAKLGSILRQLGESGGDVDWTRSTLIEHGTSAYEQEAYESPQSSQFLKNRYDPDLNHMRAESTERFASSVAPTIQGIQKTTQNALFTDHAPRFVRYTNANTGDYRDLAPGTAVLMEEGLDPLDENLQGTISIATALAASSAVSKMGLERIKGDQSVPDEGTPYGGDTAYRGNVIESVRHHLGNALDRAGVKLSQQGLRRLAIAKVEAMEREGEFVPVSSLIDGETRQVLAPSPMMSNQARSIDRFARAFTSDVGRGAAASVPLLGGRGIVDGGTGVTYQSLKPKKGGIVRSAVESAKTILSSMGHRYTKANVERKSFELDDVLSPDWIEVDPVTGKPMYSRHRFAERHKVHESAYKAAKARVRPPPGYIKDDPASEAKWEESQQRQALEVMDMKFKNLKTYFKMIEEGQGRNLFQRFIHAFNNHRLYPNANNLDYTASKEVIRDTMSFSLVEKVQPRYLFDPIHVANLQDKNREIWISHKDRNGNEVRIRSDNTNFGPDVHEKLEALHPMELAGMGAMRAAVIYHATAIEPISHPESNKLLDVTRMSSGDAISYYDPRIGNDLADLGKQYVAYKELRRKHKEATAAAAATGQPAPEPVNEAPFERMLNLWAHVDPGAAQAVLNLWEDFHNMREATLRGRDGAVPIELTHQAIADGNQSGIMFQAVFYGFATADAGSKRSSRNVLSMLAQANPTQQDLRVFGWGTVQRELVDSLADSPDLQLGWMEFFKELQGENQENLSQVASDGFKKPLMQAAYSKNPLAFLNEAQDFLEDDQVANAFKNHLEHLYNLNSASAAEDLRDAIGKALLQIIDSRSNRVMMNFSQWMAIQNQPIHIKGPTGDSIVISAVGVSTVNLGGHSRNVSNLPVEVAGRKFHIKVPNLKTDTLYSERGEEGQPIDYPVNERQYQPAARRIKSYFNRTTREISTVVEPFGYALRRMAPVLLIQALDGDGMAMMINWVNSFKNRPRGLPPRPVITVHDSSISSPGSALIYENAYNNVVIPHMMDHIKDMGKALKKNADDAEREVHKYLDQQEASGGLIGIGADGEYPALGGILNEYHEKVYRTDEKDYANFVKNKEWLQDQRKNWKSLLDRAEKAGWVPMTFFQNIQHESHIIPGTLAVTPAQARELFEIAKEFIGISDKVASGNVMKWLEEHSARVVKAKKELYQITSHGGITQLSPASFKGEKGAPESKRPGMTRAEWKAEKEAQKSVAQMAADFIKEKGIDDLPKHEGLSKTPQEIEAGKQAAMREAVNRQVRKRVFEDARAALIKSGLMKVSGQGGRVDNSQLESMVRGLINDTPVEDLKLSKIIQQVKDSLTKIQKATPSFEEMQDEDDVNPFD